MRGQVETRLVRRVGHTLHITVKARVAEDSRRCTIGVQYKCSVMNQTTRYAGICPTTDRTRIFRNISCSHAAIAPGALVNTPRAPRRLYTP